MNADALRRDGQIGAKEQDHAYRVPSKKPPETHKAIRQILFEATFDKAEDRNTLIKFTQAEICIGSTQMGFSASNL